MKREMQTDRLIKLAHPTIPESAIERAVAVLRSGALVQGRCVQELEAELCKYIGVSFAVVVSSGTAALHLALLASDIGPGDEVIVPAFTFPATANAVVLTGAIPVAVDISLDDFNIDPLNLEVAVTSRTRAILPVHEFGLPADMVVLTDIAKKRNLTVIEDAACALGAEIDGRRVGSTGNLTCFSFHPRKAITSGEGGVVVTNDFAAAERLRSLRNHGITTQDGRMDIAEAAPNYRMTDFQAALAIEQLATLDTQIEYREKVSQSYDRLMRNNPDISPPQHIPGRRHVYQTYHVLVNELVDRDALIAAMRARGVEVNFGAWALNLLTLYRNRFDFHPDAYPNAVRAFNSGLALPIGAHLSLGDTEMVVRTLTECLECIIAPV